MTKCGTDHKLVITYGFLLFTSNKLLATNYFFLCFFAPLRGYNI